LTEIFSNWGKIKRVELVLDRVSQLSKGFAYIDYEENEGAITAIARMDGAQIDGNQITVQYTLPRRNRSPIRSWQRRPEPRRGGGGYGGSRYGGRRSPVRGSRYGGWRAAARGPGTRRWSPPPRRRSRS